MPAIASAGALLAGAGAGGVGLTMSGLIGASLGANLLTGLLNYKTEKDTLAWQKGVQREIFSREDTAIARRVADLKASGLSPVLAAGQGAGTGGYVPVTAPQLHKFGDSLADSVITAMNLLRMEADISATRAQEEYTRMQQQRLSELLPVELQQMRTNIDNTNAQTFKTYQEGKKAKVEANNMTTTGTSGSNVFSQLFRDYMGSSNTVSDNVKKVLDGKAKGKSTKNPIKPFWTPEGRKDIQKRLKDARSGKIKFKY
jgi:hypothetical protein